MKASYRKSSITLIGAYDDKKFIESVAHFLVINHSYSNKTYGECDEYKGVYTIVLNTSKTVKESRKCYVDAKTKAFFADIKEFQNRG